MSSQDCDHWTLYALSPEQEGGSDEGVYLIDDRHFRVAKPHDPIGFLIENFSCFLGLTAKDNIHPALAELQFILNENARAATLLRCRSNRIVS